MLKVLFTLFFFFFWFQNLSMNLLKIFAKYVLYKSV